MTEYKVGDIIFIEKCGNGFGCDKCASRVVEVKAVCDDFVEFYLDSLKDECFVDIEYGDEGDRFRHATDREKFLYYTYGEDFLRLKK